MGDGTTCHYCRRSMNFCECPPSQWEIELDDKDRIIWVLTNKLLSIYTCAIIVTSSNSLQDNSKFFTLILNGLPVSDCMQLGTTLTGIKLNNKARYLIDMAMSGKSIVPSKFT